MLILRSSNPEPPMSAMGQKRTLKAPRADVRFAPKADMDQDSRDVRVCQKQTLRCLSKEKPGMAAPGVFICVS